MKKIQIILSLGIIIIVLFNGCKKDHKTTTPTPTYYDLTPDEVAFWDSEPSINVPLDSVILPNQLHVTEFLQQIGASINGKQEYGTATKDLGPQDAKNELIANLMTASDLLTNRNNFVYPDEGPHKPAQHGLAYSWGQRDYQHRLLPPGDGNTCDDEVYGLDCSGFLYQIFHMSGVEISDGKAEVQRKPAEIEAAIKKAYPKLTKIKVEDLGKITNVQSGDIIYWIEADKTAHHIGVILKRGSGFVVAQSNGDQNIACNTNYGNNRGPRYSSFANAILPAVPAVKNGKRGFGDNYGIVRINTDISGQWTFSFKCDGDYQTLSSVDLNFPTQQSDSFTISKAVTDYDGSPTNIVFNFTYDNIANQLACTWVTTDSSIPGFERKDQFSIALFRDDIPYQTVQNDYINNGSGCIEDIELSDNESQGTAVALLPPNRRPRAPTTRLP